MMLVSQIAAELHFGICTIFFKRVAGGLCIFGKGKWRGNAQEAGGWGPKR